jgi:hypothetical protein
VPAVVSAQAPTEINHSRLRQIYTNMRGRGVVLNFIPLGPFVDAKNPEEMVAATEKALIAAVRDEPKN